MEETEKKFEKWSKAEIIKAAAEIGPEKAELLKRLDAETLRNYCLYSTRYMYSASDSNAPDLHAIDWDFITKVTPEYVDKIIAANAKTEEDNSTDKVSSVARKIKMHVSSKQFKCKPTGVEIGNLKMEFARPESIQDLTVEEIINVATSGQTFQPGVTPLSEKSKSEGRKGTRYEDFTQQQALLIDIDNKYDEIPYETPESAEKKLNGHNLQPVFMYWTFSSTEERKKFRIVLVSDEIITDRNERDRIQAALIILFPQADKGCKNADRMFFGTDKGVCQGIGNISAVCRKSDLLALADALLTADEQDIKTKNVSAASPKKQPEESAETRSKSSEAGTILQGSRHNTMIKFAAAVLKRCGDEDGKAYELYSQRALDCDPPLDDKELESCWESALKLYTTKIKTAPGYINPSEYGSAKNLIPAPNDETDLGQANIFVSEYGDRIRYSKKTGFLVYNGKVWKENELDAQGLAQELTERQLKVAQKGLEEARRMLEAAVQSNDKGKIEAASLALSLAKNFSSFVKCRRQSNKIKATLKEAEAKVPIDLSELDANGFLLNTPAGTVDLKTGEMRPHNAQDYCTKITAAEPSDENADIFAEFLGRVTVGDEDLQRYLQEIAGMCAIGKVLRENLIIASGRGGNGKSTLFNLLSRVLGDYAGSIPSKVLTADCRQNKSPDLAELRGKRLVIAAELEEGTRLDTGVVKNICSVDPISAQKKFKDPFVFIPSHTCVLYTNHLPKVGTLDKGTWDRLIVIPFNGKFRGEKSEIINYGEDLFEHCGGAVLKWIIEGAKRFTANKFKIELPDCVKNAVQDYHEDNDWLEKFIEKCCVKDPEAAQPSGELYEVYSAYCNTTGEYRRRASDLKAALLGKEYKWRKTNVASMYYGLRVMSEEEQRAKQTDNPEMNTAE